MGMRTVKKLILVWVVLFSDCCCGIKNNNNLDTNNLVDATSRQLSSYPQAVSFFPHDDDNEDSSNKYNSQSQQQPYASQYSQNVPTIDYSYNHQPQYDNSQPNQDNFRFSNEPRQETYFMNQNEVIPQRQESYYPNQNEVIPLPVRPRKYYQSQRPNQITNSNYYKKYRLIPPVYNNYYDQNPGVFEQYATPEQNYPPQSYYQPAYQNNENYAGQFGNYFNGAPPNQPPNSQPGNFPNQLFGGLFGGSAGNGGPQSPNQFNDSPFGANAGNQLTKAIEDISSNDDYQCVPKLLCQMVGNPRRPNNLPSFLTGPALTTLIAALPSNSPFLNFGRAALLGISGGERSCDSAYPKCPRNEDDLLFYLNNHRGGFFRFFNGGAAFGDDTGSIYHNYQNQNQNNPNHQNQNYQPQNLQSTFSNLATLQNLASAFNQNGGINLSNLGANAGLLSSLASLAGYQNKNNDDGVKSPQSSGNGVGDFVTNLLTGLVGNRFAGRRISKRSIDVQNKDDDEDDEKKIIRGISRKRNLDLELINPYESFESKKIKFPNSESKVIQKLLNSNQNSIEITPDLKPVAQRRILNLNDPQIPVVFETTNKLEAQNEFFPKEQQYIFQFVETNRVPKQFFPNNLPFNLPTTTTVHSGNAVSYQNVLRFPSDNSVADDHRDIKGLKFLDEHAHFIPRPLDYYDTTKMIFPDRTGTGNLRFDNDVFHAMRFGKILNRQPPTTSTPTPPLYSNQNNYQYYNQFSYPTSSSTSSSSSQQSSTRPNYYTYSPAIRDQTQSANTDNNVYVTNGQGVVEYILNERGEKIYT